jgi:hypothetical protein
MKEIKELVYLGQLAVFYVPVQKLDLLEFGKDRQTPRMLFEEFLMENYNAFTLTITNMQGFWRQDKHGPISREQNARYDVSFEGDVEPFVLFLSEMCYRLQEQSIYLTMGSKSWLVLPKERDEV